MILASILLCAMAQFSHSAVPCADPALTCRITSPAAIAVDPWAPPPGRFYDAFRTSGISYWSQMIAIASYLEAEAKFLEVCPLCTRAEAELFLRYASGHYYNRFWDAYGISTNAKRRARAVYREWLTAIGA